MGLVDLHDKTILVTGASSGIGKAIVHLLAKLGAKCILVARNTTKLREVVQTIPGNHVIAPYDLLALDGICTWMKELAKEHAPFHGLVHSAGVHSAKPLQLLTIHDLNHIMSINLYAAIMLSKGFRLKSVHHHTNSSIVFISSILASVGQAGKGALFSLTKSLAIELMRDKIRVNVISSGVVDTEMTASFLAKMGKAQADLYKTQHPLGFGKATDIASMAAFLLSENAAWITGANMVVDGGYTAV